MREASIKTSNRNESFESKTYQIEPIGKGK